MKILILPLLLLLWSCNNSTESPKNKTLKAADTTIEKEKLSDTTSDREDEEFEKFLQRFSKDSSYQLSRIKFPIKVTSTDGEMEEIKLLNKTDWIFTDYSRQDKEKFSSEKINSGLINLIYTLEDTGVLVYHFFEKKKGKWMLVSIEDHST